MGKEKNFSGLSFAFLPDRVTNWWHFSFSTYRVNNQHQQTDESPLPPNF